MRDFCAVRGTKILVVDDDQDIRELLLAVLADDGYEAEAAQNGKDALDVLERWRADVVVLDLMMPIMDGWTFAARMREKKIEIPIVVISAATDLRRHGQSVHAADIVTKPFDIDALLPRIARVAAANGGGSAAF